MLSPVIISLALLAGQSDPPIKVWLNSQVYAAGDDAAQVHFRVAQDGYVVILRADVDGHIRVLVPIDPGVDNWVRGGKDFGVKGRANRDDTFQIESREGTGTVLAAYSASPFTFDHFLLGDHWDFRVLGAVPQDQDAETVLLDVIREMAGQNGQFDYDVVQYQVSNGGGGAYHSHVSVGVGFGWGYNPWTFGVGIGWGWPYYPGCWGCYGYGYGYYPYGYYGYYPYWGGYYPYAPYPRPYAPYPYYLHAGYPYTFKPVVPGGGGITPPRPRSGVGVTAGFGGTTTHQPTFTTPGFQPRQRTPAPAGVHPSDPRATEWDRARQSAGQHPAPHAPPPSQPHPRERSNNPKSGSGSHGGQSQPRSREPQHSAALSQFGGRGGTRSYSEPSSRSYGFGGFTRRQPSSGGSFRSFGFSGGGFRAAPRSGGGGGGGGGFRRH